MQALPTECWSAVSTLLTAHDISKLIVCGDKQLSRALLTHGAIRSLTMERRRTFEPGLSPTDIAVQLPSFIANLDGLTSLSLLLDHSNYLYARFQGLKLVTLPKSLTAIRLRSHNAMASIMPQLQASFDQKQAFKMEDYLPHLKHLDITSTEVLNLTFIEFLHRDLLTLNIKCGIHHLRPQHVDLFPKNLSSLELIHWSRFREPCADRVSAHEQQLLDSYSSISEVKWPSSLHDLSISLGWRLNNLGVLPLSLSTFKFVFPELDRSRPLHWMEARSLRGEPNDYDFLEKLLPTGLRSLHLETNLAFESFVPDRLPKRLTELFWMDASKASPNLPDSAIESLPPHLTRIHLPPQTLETSNWALLPSNLTDLGSSKTAGFLVYLPPYLRKLALIGIQDQTPVPQFPSSLKDLRFMFSTLTPHLIKSLPRGLTKLDIELGSCVPGGNFAQDLPPTLKFLRTTSIPFGSRLSDLPASLECLCIHHQHFESLSLHQLDGMQTTLINLRTLSILGARVSLLDEDSFAFMPRNLTHLEMPFNGILKDVSQFCHLPDTLKILELKTVSNENSTRSRICFTYLTPEQFAHFPRNLEFLLLPPLDTGLLRNDCHYISKLAEFVPSKLKHPIYAIAGSLLQLGSSPLISATKRFEYPRGIPDHSYIGHYDQNGSWRQPERIGLERFPPSQ